MSDELSVFLLFFPMWFVLFGGMAVFLFSLLYSPLLIIFFLKSKKWFCRLTTIVLILNAIYFALFNFILMSGGRIVDYDMYVLFGVGLLFLSILGSLIKIRTFEKKWLIFVLIFINLWLSCYPFYELFLAGMSV